MPGIVDLIGVVVDFITELFQWDEEKKEGASKKALVLSGVGMAMGLGLSALLIF